MRYHRADHISAPSIDVVYKRVCELPSRCGCKGPALEILTEAERLEDK